MDKEDGHDGFGISETQPIELKTIVIDDCPTQSVILTLVNFRISKLGNLIAQNYELGCLGSASIF